MDAVTDPIADTVAVIEFVTRWKGNTGSERANFQSFMRDLCGLLDLPLPDPGEGENEHNAYVFERFIAPQRADSTTEKRYIDLYRRDCFVLEGKQTGKMLATQSHQNAINAAVSQAERYVRGLPLEEVEHGRPPFVMVVDVGNAIYLFAEFSRTGGNYVAYPDPRHHEIRLDDLHRPEVQDRLRRLWLDPESLDPSRHAARVTKQVSATLAQLAKSLEQGGFEVERVANFLKRCLFTMFAEDVELLPAGSFHDLLIDIKDRNPKAFPHAVKGLWETMNAGGYSERLMQTIKRFNGGLFKGIDPIPLTVEQIQLLIDAAKADWRFVEPAIFGTLLERALDPRERHKLGAHYTPRAYVERLVMPTLIEPLREEWGDVRGAAETLLRQGKSDKALQEVQAFHYRLCQVRVLDPACGSANFLYVSLEHMKRLEGEVLAFIAEQSQGQGMLETEGLTVDPHQFLGMEIKRNRLLKERPMDMSESRIFAQYLFDREVKRKEIMDQQCRYFLSVLALLLALISSLQGFQKKINFSNKVFIDLQHGLSSDIKSLLFLSLAALFLFSLIFLVISVYNASKLRQWSAGIPRNFSDLLTDHTTYYDRQAIEKQFTSFLIAGYGINSRINDKRGEWIWRCWLALFITLLIILGAWLLRSY